MTRVVVILLIVLVAVALIRLVRQTAAAAAAPPKPPRLGWLDDDGAPRGERWDGSWLSGPRTALSLA